MKARRQIRPFRDLTTDPPPQYPHRVRRARPEELRDDWPTITFYGSNVDDLLLHPLREKRRQ